MKFIFIVVLKIESLIRLQRVYPLIWHYIFPGVSNRCKLMIGKQIDQSISIDKIS